MARWGGGGVSGVLSLHSQIQLRVSVLLIYQEDQINSHPMPNYINRLQFKSKSISRGKWGGGRTNTHTHAPNTHTHTKHAHTPNPHTHTYTQIYQARTRTHTHTQQTPHTHTKSHQDGSSRPLHPASLTQRSGLEQITSKCVGVGNRSPAVCWCW